MECKKALEASDNDTEKALDWLRREYFITYCRLAACFIWKELHTASYLDSMTWDPKYCDTLVCYYRSRVANIFCFVTKLVHLNLNADTKT